MRPELRKQAPGAGGSEESEPCVFCFHLHTLTHTSPPRPPPWVLKKSDISGSFKEEENHTGRQNAPEASTRLPQSCVSKEAPLGHHGTQSASHTSVKAPGMDPPCGTTGGWRVRDRQSTATRRPSASSPPSQQPSLAQGMLGNSGHPGPGD